ncbi:hypothetical protein AAXE64_07580 [Priestia megaterium]
MSNRVKGLYVSFSEDLHEETVEYITNAIKMIKGIQDVSSNVVNPDDWMNRKRIAVEFKEEIYNVLKDLDK